MANYDPTWVGEPNAYGTIKLHKIGTSAAEDFTLSPGDCILVKRVNRAPKALRIKQFTGTPNVVDGIMFTCSAPAIEFSELNLIITKINCSNLNPPAAAGGSRRTRHRSRRYSRSRRSRSRRS